MNKAQMQDQIAPGSVGLSISTIWMTYGSIPADLTEAKYAALTAAFGVVFTALVNVIRRFTTKLPSVPIDIIDAGERSPQSKDPS